MPLSIPVVMFILGRRSLHETLIMWTVIVCVASFIFFMVGQNAAHHHPDIFHDGDTPRYVTKRLTNLFLLYNLLGIPKK